MTSSFNIIHHKDGVPPPKHVYEPVPVFKKTVDQQRYWELQKERWIEGYNGLTGPHYFYLQECWLKAGTKGDLIRPFWRDVDEFMFEGIQLAQTKGRNECGIIKRREVGLTSIGAGCLPMYYMRVYPGCTVIMTSCDKPRIYKMFNDKTMVVYNNMNKSIQPKVVSLNQTKNNVYLKSKITTVVDGVEQVREGDIYCQETVENPKAFSSTRCAYGFFDELPLHTKREKLIASSEACFMDSGVKSGFLLWGGTIEDGIGTETLIDMRQMVADSEGAGRSLIFVPAWMGLENITENGKVVKIMKNGYSDKERGTAWVEAELERREKYESATRYQGFRKNYPLTIEGALEISDGGILPVEIMEALNDREKVLRANPPPIGKYKLIRQEDNSVVAVPHKRGKFLILSHPQEGILYTSGTDPIPFNDAAIADGSDYALTMKDYDNQNYVGFYAERNMDADDVIENCILFQDYYFGAKTMLERNVGGVALAKYKDAGRSDLLANQPTSLGIKFIDKRVKKGYYKNEQTSGRCNDLLIKYLKQYASSISFERMIEEIRRYLIDNTDLLDAMLANELYDADITKKKAKKMGKSRIKRVPMMIRDKDGKTIRIIQEIIMPETK